MIISLSCLERAHGNLAARSGQAAASEPIQWPGTQEIDRGEGMAVTAERFNQGMSYDEFKAQLSRARESYERNDQQLQLTEEDLAPFRGAAPFKVLVIVTETCPDVINNLPILVRIGRET